MYKVRLARVYAGQLELVDRQQKPPAVWNMAQVDVFHNRRHIDSAGGFFETAPDLDIWSCGAVLGRRLKDSRASDYITINGTVYLMPEMKFVQVARLPEHQIRLLERGIKARLYENGDNAEDLLELLQGVGEQ